MSGRADDGGSDLEGKGMGKAAVTILAVLASAGPAPAAKDIPIADFEGKDYGQWKAYGKAFGRGPARGTFGRQQKVSGFAGKGLVNTYLGGDAPRGTLTSPLFAIQRRHINFLIGGGGHVGLTCVNLLVDKKVIRTATGRNNERLLWASWDVAAFKGKLARIRIVDNASGGWGHINVDQIVQSDTPRKASRGRPAPAPRPSRRPAPAAAGNRAEALAQLTKHGVNEIIFTTRQVDGDGHWYANFSYWSNNPSRKLYHEGGRLCRLHIATGKVTVLIDDPKGGVRDPKMHYDGKKILVSYRKSGQPYYNLYEINIDGTGLRQITKEPFDDIEPTYLPNGDIVFCSSRANRFVQCYYVRVATIHRCKPDGSGIRELSCNVEHDNTPWVLPDGRILYQRWEYIDRSQVRFHHLWTMNPDGTGQMVYFGNMYGGTVMIDAKPIPGTKKVVASFSPGHGRKEHAGTITIVDPSNGPDDRSMARTVTRGHYRDPYPLSEDCFLVARHTDICVIYGGGKVAQLYDMPAEWKVGAMQIHEPRPLRGRRRERIRPELVDLAQTTGTVTLENVYVGRNMKGITKGEIKKLLILEALPKPVNFSGGMEPLTMGGSFTLERILGTVPVEDDGSAHMELPALRSLFFVALDANDVSVKRMQSFMTVQPGERLSCLGCHEERGTTALPRRRAKAMFRPASTIRPIAEVPDVFDFPRDIQPILDRHCVSCHGPVKTAQGGPYAGKVLLDGGRGGMYSHSYAMLTLKRQVADGRNGDGNRPPRSIGACASPLMNKLEPGHHKVAMTAHEKKMIRYWIESAAAYPGTYAALGTGMVRGIGRDGGMRKAFASRCGTCHRGARFNEHVAFNLSDPAKSLVLTMPLDPKAGGGGMVRKVKKDGKTADQCIVVFKDTKDPDYQTILAGITKDKARLDRIKRFDMPDFRPNEHYIREMKVYGVLPESFKDKTDPIDCYKVDRAYWRSLWYCPPRPQESR